MKRVRRRIMGIRGNSALHTDPYIESLQKHEQVAPVFRTKACISLVFQLQIHCNNRPTLYRDHYYPY